MKRSVCSCLVVMGLAGCGGGNDGTIVFQSGRDGNFEIYSMNADGSEQRRLTDSPANDVSPSWSPDGTTILFASDRTGNWEIYTMAEDGSHCVQRTNGQGANTAPSWAEGGRTILFVSSRDALQGEIYRMDADGGNVRRLTADALVKDAPVMTPDGKTILFTANIKERYRIASFSPATGTTSLLTPPECNSGAPALSPDGARVLFVSDRDGNTDIYVMPLTGEHPVRLTVNTADDGTPAWTSDPQEILLSRKGGITMLSLATARERMLSYKGDGAPHWRPR